MFDLSATSLLVRSLGLRHYQEIWQQMRNFTQQRSAETADELWLVQHPSIYTLGKRGGSDPHSGGKNYPVIASDRGGLATYHGPGQLIGYFMVDHVRLNWSAQDLVAITENFLLNVLKKHSCIGKLSKEFGPGIYTQNKKIASLGYRMTQKGSYHGFSLNIRMDLRPFSWIDPCGSNHLEVTQLADYQSNISVTMVISSLLNLLPNHIPHRIMPLVTCSHFLQEINYGTHITAT